MTGLAEPASPPVIDVAWIRAHCHLQLVMHIAGRDCHVLVQAIVETATGREIGLRRHMTSWKPHKRLGDRAGRCERFWIVAGHSETVDRLHEALEILRIIRLGGGAPS